MNQIPIITIVCIANYCRSPVAEAILRDRFKGTFSLQSAGISPISEVSMDPRSSRFLEEEKIPQFTHIPKKITKQMVKESKYVFALDMEVLLLLNKEFPNNYEKIKNLGHQDSRARLNDPYKMNDENYRKIMQNIRKVCSDIILV